MISKAITGVAAVGLVAALLFFNLWRDAVEDLEAEQLANDTTKLEEVHASKVIQMQGDIDALENKLANRDKTIEAQRSAWSASESALEVATEIAANHESTIEQLMLQGETNEIPDSRECLNVFVPRPAIEWLCKQAESGQGAGADAGPGAGGDCGDPGGVFGADPAYSDFASITYGGALVRWGYDRKGLSTCNTHKAAIKRIQEQLLTEQ